MRRSASEIVRNLEDRIARLENKTASMKLLESDKWLGKALNNCKTVEEFPFDAITYYSKNDQEDAGEDSGVVSVCSFKLFYAQQQSYVVVTKIFSPEADPVSTEGFFSTLREAKAFAKKLQAKYSEPKYEY